MIKLLRAAPAPAFDWRWPEELEHFDHAWELLLHVDRREVPVRYALTRGDRYGHLRVRAVAWVEGVPQVEGVEADDYPRSRSLLSIIRSDGKRHARESADVPAGYEGFVIVRHSDEIEAPRSPKSLAVKIVEDDFERWATHALIRLSSKQKD